MLSKESAESEGSSVGSCKQRRILKVEKKAQNEHVQEMKSGVKSTDFTRAARAFSYEEEEACQRDALADLQLHRDVCAELRQVMDCIRNLKESGSDVEKHNIDELKAHGMLQFVSLKKLNRIAHFRSKKVRDSTNECKLKVDQHHLKLQNLLYEVGHLEKEIGKCLQFKSKDEEICLVPVEQFFKEAPADIAKTSLAQSDSHHLQLARLHWELEQRKRLSGQLKEAAGLKDHIMTDIKAKKEFLDSLQPKLKAILQATKPVQDQLDMPFDVVREQHKTASYLPSPLYVLYVQAAAYAEACDKNLVVTINGDVELARTMEQMPVIIDEKENDEENDDQDKLTDTGHRRTTSQHDKSSHLLHKHPLNVALIVNCPDKSQLSLTFFYIMSLGIVTVSTKLSTHNTTSTISAGDLLMPDSLLNCLYAGDDGSTTPNPANTYTTLLGEFSKYVSEVGRPYRWVQWLCGLQFLANDAALKPQVSVSACHMADTIHRLRQRVYNRLSLQKMLAALELCQIPIPSECVSQYPVKVSSRLAQWKRSTFSDFIACSYTQRFIELDVVRSDSMYFTATLQRGSAVLTAQVVVAADYPNASSLMALSLLWHSPVPRTALNDDAIRDMEIEVNLCDSDVCGNAAAASVHLLANQLQHLLVCLEVYLETSCAITNSPEFPQDRICSRLTRGRNRARPYKYVSQLCFFTQR